MSDLDDFFRAKNAELVLKVESEFGMSFIDVLKDYAKDHSFHFAYKSLGTTAYTLMPYQHLFKPNKHGYNERPHIKERNLLKARRYFGRTVTELAEVAGTSKETIRRRIKAGKPYEEVVKPPAKKGCVQNFKGKRDNSLWRKKIDLECSNAKSRKTVLE